MKMKLTKTQFVEFIKTLQNSLEKARNKADLLGKVYENAFEANLMLFDDALADDLIKCISLHFKDPKQAYSAIDWWVWELDFGSEAYRLPINGNTYLTTAEELYEYLIS